MKNVFTKVLYALGVLSVVAFIYVTGMAVVFGPSLIPTVLNYLW